MKYVIIFENKSNGARLTYEAFPYDGRSAEENTIDCIKYNISNGNRLVSITPAELDGTEEPDLSDDEF